MCTHTYTHTRKYLTHGGLRATVCQFSRGAFTYERAIPARVSCVLRSKETSAACGIFCVLFLTECNKVKFKQRYDCI